MEMKISNLINCFISLFLFFITVWPEVNRNSNGSYPYHNTLKSQELDNTLKNKHTHTSKWLAARDI